MPDVASAGVREIADIAVLNEQPLSVANIGHVLLQILRDSSCGGKQAEQNENTANGCPNLHCHPAPRFPILYTRISKVWWSEKRSAQIGRVPIEIATSTSPSEGQSSPPPE